METHIHGQSLNSIGVRNRQEVGFMMILSKVIKRDNK